MEDFPETAAPDCRLAVHHLLVRWRHSRCCNGFRQGSGAAVGDCIPGNLPRRQLETEPQAKPAGFSLSGPERIHAVPKRRPHLLAPPHLRRRDGPSPQNPGLVALTALEGGRRRRARLLLGPVGDRRVGGPARCLFVQPTGSCLVVPAPGVIRVRTSGGGIAVAVFGGLAASRRPEQPHLTRPGRDRRAAGPAGSRRRRNSPDPGPGLSERHCHRSRLYRRPLCSWLLPRSSPARPGRPHARLGGARPGPSRGTGPSGRPPGRPRLALTAARPRRQAARPRDRGLSRRPFACSFGVAVREVLIDGGEIDVAGLGGSAASRPTGQRAEPGGAVGASSSTG